MIFEVRVAAKEFALLNYHFICLTSSAWELSSSMLILSTYCAAVRIPGQCCSALVKRALKAAKPLQARERCVLRGRLKEKDFMGPCGFV